MTADKWSAGQIKTAELLSFELLIGAVIARRSRGRSFSNYCE
jgi:hypothetical protein